MTDVRGGRGGRGLKYSQSSHCRPADLEILLILTMGVLPILYRTFGIISIFSFLQQNIPAQLRSRTECYSRFVERVRSLSHCLQVHLGLVWFPGAPGGQVRSHKSHRAAVTLLASGGALLPLPRESDRTHRGTRTSLGWRHDQC